MPHFVGARYEKINRAGADLESLSVEPWELAADLVDVDLVLDIRTAEQFARARLAGAVNLTYNDFQQHALSHVEDGMTVLVVDPAGARAAEMAVWLRSKGVLARYLVGGMAAWRGPLEKN